MKARSKKVLILLVKLAVAAGLIYLVLRQVHWGDYTETINQQVFQRKGFRSVLTSANPLFLAGALGCFLLPMFILAVRWWYLLSILGIHIPLWESVRLTFLGTFFNYIMPGVVSGDLVKAYYVFKHTDRKAAALVSIFVDRVVGLLQFAVLPAAIIAALAAAGRWDDRLRLPMFVIAVVIGAVAAVAAVVVSPALRRRLAQVFSFLPLQRHLGMAGQAVELYRRRLTGLLKALLITFGSQVVFITGLMLAGKSFGLPTPWYHYFLYCPLIYIIASVPLTPGGAGVMEWFFVKFFAVGETTASAVLALALVARLGPMICSLPGIGVALTGAKLPKGEDIEAEMAAAPGE